ncbi:MAG TPA: hypothetical protein H9807_05260 [Candidatus Bacteroides merdavium]|uniref:Uncharacterized protein n=1 Tax=Candidatus Bacteroides merdavium TaxID=2838472 RepID=A0A9D2KDS8_9BACE|nr:hypothetical protein [uncultured Bacteroides sp.]HIZ91506.1 hypothetical protein [Candidatus Bacteroides merdavium]
MKKLAVLFVASASLCLAACHSDSQKSDADVQEVSLISDSVIICSGRLVMGHESYAFVPDGDTLAYWVVDRSGDLKKYYEEALPADAEPYTPVSAELKVKMMGPSSEGFAADYDGVVEIQEIIRVGE